MHKVPQEMQFHVYQCMRETCQLRFTAEAGDPRAARCPKCRAPTSTLGSAFHQAVINQPADGERIYAASPMLEVFLDNIRSAWNVGSMFRAADGAGVRKIHLCGVSATPDHPAVAKTALGAEKHLPWVCHPDGVAAVRKLKQEGMVVWALEGGDRSESLFDVSPTAIPRHSVIGLVVGNELTGVDPGLLELCDRVVNLPMMGVKGSLNVAVAFGIAVYTIRFGKVS